MKKHQFLLTGIISLSCLAFCVLASVACGAKSVGFQTVIRSLFHLGENSFDGNVVQARIPRTVFGILAGAALSISGALMQAITRNPILVFWVSIRELPFLLCSESRFFI